MMFSIPYREYWPAPEVSRALNLFLILHADHEQNHCSTSTVRMVASSQANMFASCSAGVCALWGPLHGGGQRRSDRDAGIHPSIRHEGLGIRRSGEEEGHQAAADGLAIGSTRISTLAPRSSRTLPTRCWSACTSAIRCWTSRCRWKTPPFTTPYFIERKLYPNVDFYSGIMLRAMGIPLNMFTVMFAMGRIPGWIANWKEIHDNPKSRIYRPRQIYTGNTIQDYVPMDQRK